MSSDYRRYVGRTVLVQLEDHTITGSLAYESQYTLTLQHAALLPENGEPTEMDGDVVIDRFRVLWVQVA